MLQLYKNTVVNPTDKKFEYLSNYNKFTFAKMQGLIKCDLANLMEFLKFEKMHNNRPIIVNRLLDLAFTEYKKEIRNALSPIGKRY